MMVNGPSTVILAVVSATPGNALAWMTAEPPPGAIVTVAGTVATPVFEELKASVTPFGALVERTTDRFWVAPGFKATLLGQRLAGGLSCSLRGGGGEC